MDLWGGVADARDGTAWAADTLTLMLSCTKGLMSVLIARLAQDGRLSFDTKVAEVWPEFAAAGKEKITVAELLGHCAGLPGLAVPITA